MAAAETARLIASLELQDRNFTRGIRNVEKGVARVDKKLGAFSGFINRNMARAIDSIGANLVSQVSIGLEEMATLEDATTSVTGAIAQVGKGWTTTADDIATAANEIEAATDAAFDDKAIVAATGTLIRYGNVTEDNLRPAMEVMTDLAARTGDVESAGTKLAKALADPTKATRVLRDVGVRLTKAEEKQIKAWVKSGKLGKAQAEILRLVGERTKDAAKNSAGPYRDALNKLGDAGEDLRRALVTGLAPAILEVSDLLTTELAKPSTINALKDIGKGLGNAFKSAVTFAKQIPWSAIGSGLQTAAKFAGELVGWFQKMPDWAQTLLIGGFVATKLPIVGDLVSELGKGLIKGVLGITAGVVNINAATVGTGVPGVGGGGGGLLSTGAKLLVPVTIAAVTIGAAKVLTDAINPGFDQHLHEGDRPLNPRDPRRFNRNGQVVREWESDLKDAGDAAEKFAGQLKGPPGGGRSPQPLKGTPRMDASSLAALRNMSINASKDAAKKADVQATTNAVKNAQSIASREASAQKAELGNIKNGLSTMDANQRAAAVAAAATTVLQGSLQAARDAIGRMTTSQAGTTAANAATSAGTTVSGAISSQTGSITRAIWGAAAAYQPVIQSTNVVNNYTQTERGGASSDSRTRRAD